MSLQVWLPLNGDLHNQGCSNSDISLVSGNTWASSGKIGNSSLTLTKLQTILPTSSCMTGAKEVSYCYWVKVNTAWSANWLDGIRWIETNGSTTSTARQEFYTNCTLVGTWYKGGSIAGKAFAPEVWTHLAATFNYNTGEANFYIDGVLKGTTTNIDKTYYCRGDFYIGDNGVDICQNDVRIYNHCLSAAEVKEISQGLVLHYKLDELLGGNLIKNGYGDLGLENWTNSSRVSTDVPSADTSIKQSFYNQWTQEQIPIVSSHQYQFSCYVKSTGTSGYTYPSFQPYDIDGKALNYFHEPDGFQSATRTTLAQSLNTGDTKIYATSLANWPDHTNNRLVAIFSYRDSHGNLYPDWEYTQNTVVYGTSTNLNKSTNVITLSSAYTGPNMPAGTSICQTVYGGTYWYPFGGITKASIANWTAKTMTFIPKNINRLKYAHSIKYLADWSNDILHAGIKLVDLTYSNIIEDNSGFKNHGNITGIIGLSADTPRYRASSYVNGSSYILTPAGSFAWNDLTQLTFAAWMKPTASMTGWRGSVGIAADTSQVARGIAITDYGNEFRGTYTNGSTYVTIATGKTLTQNEWHHCAGTLNGTEFKLYFDGELVKTQAIDWGTASLNTGARFEVGVDLPGSDEKFIGNYSDIRCYCTALTTADILQLYHTSAKADNLGGFHAFELSETNNGIELLAVPLTTSYGNHTNVYTEYDSNGEITLTGGSSIGSYYIPINPTGKTYYYDIEVSTDSGNAFYIGFQRYDANKTARSNDATVYLSGLSGSKEARVHAHYHGTVNLSTDGVNPCAFTSLRILNDWSGANGRHATIHKISLREVSTLQNTKINKYGQVITTELIEMNDKFRVQKNGIIEANEFLEL